MGIKKTAAAPPPAVEPEIIYEDKVVPKYVDDVKYVEVEVFFFCLLLRI